MAKLTKNKSKLSFAGIDGGKIHRQMMTSHLKSLRKNKNDVYAVMKDNLDELQTKKVITEEEKSYLNLIIDAIDPRNQVNNVVRRIENIDKFLKSTNANPVVLAISSIAVDSAKFHFPKGGKVVTPMKFKMPHWLKVVGADVGGALTGANAGAKIGSIIPVIGTGWGAAGGAVIGGAAGSIAAY